MKGKLKTRISNNNVAPINSIASCFPIFLDNFNSIAVYLDDQCNIVAINQAAEQYFEISRDNILGKDFSLLKNSDELLENFDKLKNCFKANKLKSVFNDSNEVSKQENLPIEWSFLNLSSYNTAGFLIIGNLFTSKQYIKVPLQDADGNVVGIIGNSLDITYRKEAEHLKLENELQKAKLEEQDRFRMIVDQVVHDIRSPLSSLLMIIKTCEKDIPEATRIVLRDAAIGIGDIANNLLNKYKKEDTKLCSHRENRQSIIISLLLFQLLTDKKYQYKNLPIKFTYNLSHDSNFVFIAAEPTNFKRMLSNLINNAAEACGRRKGKISVKLDADSNHTTIIIQDNGKGIPQEVIDKILKAIPVTSGKKGGHGIGLQQVQETVRSNKGMFAINSRLGKGTKVTLTFPRIEPPDWVAERIKLKKGDVVVILDDDASIHGAWKARFKNYIADVSLQHFTSGEETIKYINAFSPKEKLFLLADFELLKQELNGLHVIERTAIKRSILVTSHYANQIVCDLAAKIGTKILPKQLASEVPIEIEGSASNNSKKVDIVIIDDSQLFADSLAALIEAKAGKIVDKYYSPQVFLKNLAQYHRDTKICLDNNLGNNITGLQLAKQLHDAGYTKLYILSGKDFEKNETPDYLTVLMKTSDPEVICGVLA